MRITRISIGILRLLISLAWMALALLLWIYGQRALGWLDSQADVILDAAIENVGVVNTLMIEISDVMDEVESSLATVESSMIDGSLVLLESRPMVDKTSQLIVEEVPQAMDDIQASMPAVIEAARTIEQTLVLLSGFKIVIPIPLASDIQLDLGVDYSPEVSLEESLASLSGSLETIPEGMRVMEADFTSADISMSVMSENLLNIAHDLDKMRAQLAEINPSIEALAASLTEIHASLEAAQTRLPRYLDTARTGLILLVVFVFLSQVPPFYDGYRLFTEQGGDGGGAQSEKPQDPETDTAGT